MELKEAVQKALTLRKIDENEAARRGEDLNRETIRALTSGRTHRMFSTTLLKLGKALGGTFLQADVTDKESWHFVPDYTFTEKAVARLEGGIDDAILLSKRLKELFDGKYRTGANYPDFVVKVVNVLLQKPDSFLWTADEEFHTQYDPDDTVYINWAEFDNLLTKIEEANLSEGNNPEARNVLLGINRLMHKANVLKGKIKEHNEDAEEIKTKKDWPKVTSRQTRFLPDPKDPEPELRDMSKFRRIPVIAPVAAGPDTISWTDGDYPVGHGSDSIECEIADPNAFAMEIRGDSMLPDLREGDMAIISPEAGHNAVSNRVYVVRYLPEGTATLKKVQFHDHSITLVPINSKYDIVTRQEKSFEIIGQMVMSQRKW